MKRKIPWLAIATVAIIVICLVVIGLGAYGYISLEGRVRALEGQSALLQSSDLQSAIDFMKDQMQYLIWILGIIIAGAGAILAFLGLNTRKSVDEAYKQTYSKLVAAKDTEVFKKQIVFLYTKNNDIFTRFQNEIRDRGHNTKVSQVSAYAISKMSDAAIVVYHVSDASDTQCQVVAKSCDLNNIHCIFYCPTKLPDVLFRELNSYSYVSTSLQIAKLRESLFTLLYLTP